MIQNMLSNLRGLLARAISSQRDGNVFGALSEYRLLLEVSRHYYQHGYQAEITGIFGQMLAAQSTPADVLHMFALVQQHVGNAEASLAAVDMALVLKNTQPHYHSSRGKILVELGRIDEAQQAFSAALNLLGNYGEAADGFFVCEAERQMPGEDYYTVLQRFHDLLRPRAYVEIGLGHGRSLALAGLGTTALGIDPVMALYERLLYAAPDKPAQLYLETSDDFFAGHDLIREMGKPTFDLGFIDGLHIFEQVLKDFINLERYAGKNSVVLIHDCVPSNALVAERERCTGFWTGDVWKIIPCLKTLRPDLQLFIIPTKPSGLAVVCNLDAGSTTLRQNYAKIVDYFAALKLPESLQEKNILLNVAENDWSKICGRLAHLQM